MLETESLENLEEGKLAKFHRRVEEIVEHIYPGAWDFNATINCGGDLVSDKVLMIKFPHIVIRNTRGSSHNIEDIYVAFRFHRRETRLASTSIYGGRGKMSSSEVVSAYLHSHLSGGAQDGFTPFCTGSTSFRDLITDLGNLWSNDPEEWETSFEAVLFQLRSYLEWESIEGKPHRRMDNIGNSTTRENINYHEVAEARHHILKAMKSEMINIVPDFATGKVSMIISDELEAVMVNAITVMDDYQEYLVIRDMNGNYVSLQSEEYKDGEIPGAEKFTFKGRTIIPSYTDIKFEQNENKRRYVHRQIVNSVRTALENSFREQWFRQEFESEASSGRNSGGKWETQDTTRAILQDFAIVSDGEQD